MFYIIICILSFALVGAMAGAVIKFFQWCIADLTFGIFFGSPTVESVLKLVVALATIGAVCGLLSGVVLVLKDRKDEKTWVENNEMGIYYRIMPPHFRNISDDDFFAEFSTCGFCKYYDQTEGCKKYGVKGYGVGSVVKTVCDDFESSLAEEEK